MNPTPKSRNEVPKSLKLDEVAKLVDGELLGEPGVLITGVAGIKEAQQGDITFLANTKYQSYLDKTKASAIITSKEVSAKEKTLIRTANPSKAFTKIISYFNRPRTTRVPGVHRTAVVDPSVRLGKDVSIGPHAVVEKGSVIGDHSTIGANTTIGERCSLGQKVLIYPNVVLREESVVGDRVIIHSGTVIGSDGFGYEAVEGKYEKIPQTGHVVIEEDVEIGANVCVDRGRFDKTWIQRGVKIDNLVQIAHNVTIGPDSLVISQTGISGSSQLGKNVILAGQVGVVGHVKIGDHAIVGAKGGVTKSVPDRAIVVGQPAKPIAEQKKIVILTAKLPELFKDVSELKKKLSGKKSHE